MFRLQFFGGFAAQSRQLLASSNVKAPAFSAVLRKTLHQLEALQAIQGQGPGAWAFWRECFALVRPIAARLMLLSVLSAVLTSCSVVATRYVLDYYEQLAISCALAVGFLFFEVGAHYCGYLSGILRGDLASSLRNHLLSKINLKLLTLDRNRCSEFSSGNLKTLVSSDINAINEFLNSVCHSWIPAFALAAVLMPLLLVLGGKIALVGICLSLLQLPLAITASRILSRSQMRLQESQDSLTTLVGEWLRNIRLVRYLGWQPQISLEIQSQLRRYSILYARRHGSLCLVFGTTSAWWTVPILGMLLVNHASATPLSLGEFFALVWGLNQIAGYLQQLPATVYTYAAAAVGAARIEKLIAAPDLRDYLESSCDGQSVALPSGTNICKIQLQQILVTYAGRTVLDIPDLELDLQKRTVIVGDVGAGKSTLLKLLLGELAPSAGSINLMSSDGTLLPLWHPSNYHAWRALCSYVPQEPFLSNATLAENVALHDSPQPETLQEALTAAELESDLAGFHAGHAQEVGETGINLSGGQKQRVNLARALYAKRKILVLDDPLSAVDKHTEELLVQTLHKLGLGILLVSHRLHQLSNFDRVLVLESGRITEDGNPHLLAADRASRFSHYLRALGDKEEAHAIS